MVTTFELQDQAVFTVTPIGSEEEVVAETKGNYVVVATILAGVGVVGYLLIRK